MLWAWGKIKNLGWCRPRVADGQYWRWFEKIVIFSENVNSSFISWEFGKLFFFLNMYSYCITITVKIITELSVVSTHSACQALICWIVTFHSEKVISLINLVCNQILAVKSPQCSCTAVNKEFLTLTFLFQTSKCYHFNYSWGLCKKKRKKHTVFLFQFKKACSFQNFRQ